MRAAPLPQDAQRVTDGAVEALDLVVGQIDRRARRVAPDLAMPVRRQELTETFVQNGAVYAFRTEMFRAHRSVFGPFPRAVVITGPLVNIDTPEDLDEARRLTAAETRR